LVLQIIRLDAESRDAEPDFGAIGAAHPELAAEQAKLYASAMEQRKQEHATFVARAAQRRHEAETSAAAAEAAKAQVPVLRDLFDIQRQLVTQGLTARKAYLETLSALLRAEGEYASAQTKLQAALATRSEAESALIQADATAAQKVAEERTKAATDHAEVERQIAKFADRLERVIVRAPSNGVVQEIVPKSPGEVVKPGDVIARIVPTGVDLVAEVRIDPKDSGHVKVGARADVKFATYDSAIFGTLTGTIDYVSPTTFVPQSSQSSSAGQAASEPYYKALIRLPSDHVGTGAKTRPISPGMVVQANIVTGSKSIARYMLKPISNSLEAAFTER
jgi:HlyD family secretion protein/adhesin transport system membrane fusion protein